MQYGIIFCSTKCKINLRRKNCIRIKFFSSLNRGTIKKRKYFCYHYIYLWGIFHATYKISVTAKIFSKQHWKSVVANQKTTQIWNLDYYLFIKVSDNFTKKCTVWVKVRLCTSRNWKSTNVYLKTTRKFMSQN